MANDPFLAIVTAAAELKRAAPAQYEHLTKAMRSYAERAKNELVVADANVIFPAQGKAQALGQLASKLEDCIALDDQYRNRSK